MKGLGREDAERIKRRALRSQAMGRISESDAAYITRRAEEIIARIVSMKETGTDEREF